jgi:predicted choloylglycine hydrolase
MVDKSGDHITAYLSPDREVVLSHTRVATNHQETVEWHRHARATATVERERFLLQRLTMHNEPAATFINAFLKPPLYSTNFPKSFGTLYTAVYRPLSGTAETHWPGQIWHHDFTQSAYDMRRVRYPDSDILKNAASKI